MVLLKQLEEAPVDVLIFSPLGCSYPLAFWFPSVFSLLARLLTGFSTNTVDVLLFSVFNHSVFLLLFQASAAAAAPASTSVTLASTPQPA